MARWPKRALAIKAPLAECFRAYFPSLPLDRASKMMGTVGLMPRQVEAHEQGWRHRGSE